MLIPRLRKSVLTSSVIPSNSIAAQFFASFHKGNDKFSFTVKGRQDKAPSKSQIRLTIRQKRADSKRALEDFLAKNGSSKHSFMEEESTLNWKAGLEDDSDIFHVKRRPKFSARNPKKLHQKKNKRKRRKDSFYECFDDRPDRTFSFRYKSFFGKEDSNWGESENSERMNSKTWGSSSESDSEPKSDDEFCAVGSLEERTLLGLPLTGPLKLEDVKKAFHASALKWHPDKHQGPLQAMGEEKFKQCVDAYKSLCKLVSTA